jgi:hypothetical protein
MPSANGLFGKDIRNFDAYLGAAVFDATGTYDIAFSMMLAVSLLALLPTLLLRQPKKQGTENYFGGTRNCFLGAGNFGSQNLSHRWIRFSVHTTMRFKPPLRRSSP